MSGYPDGDYPPMPGALMLEWLPVDAEGADYVQTTLNGDRLDIPDDATALKVKAELEALGYQLTRDDDSIRMLFQ